MRNCAFLWLRLRGRIWSTAWLLALLAGLIGGPGVARAEYVVYDAQVEAYHVTVWARPNPISEGKVHLLIRVGRAANVSQEFPVQQARITVRFEPLGEAGAPPPTGPSYSYKELVATESEPGTYEMEDSLFTAGQFRANIKLDSSFGKSATAFEFKALPPPDDRLLSLLLLALFPLGLFTLLYFYVRRPKSSGPGGSTPDPQPNVEPASEILPRR